MFALLYFMLTFASAATYEAEVSVKVPLNPPPAGAGTQHHGTVFGKLQSGFPTDVTVTSTWSKLKCRVDAKSNVYIYIEGNNSTWPTALPSPAEASCTHVYGGDTYIVNITLAQDTDVDWDESSWKGFSTGWVIDAPAQGIIRAYDDLPAETGGWTYDVGVWRAVKSGSPWNGVWCEIQEVPEGHWFIARAIMGGVTAGTGHCVIKRTGASNYNVPISITLDP